MKHSIVRNRFSRLRVYSPDFETPEKVRTQQQFKDECDMNLIVQKASRGIAPARFQRGEAMYGDFSKIPDLTEAYDLVIRAEEAFMTLPAALRLELNNDPSNLNSLTKEQIDRYGLRKESGTLPPSQPPKSSPPAGQAVSGGTEPPNSTSKKSKPNDADPAS